MIQLWIYIVACGSHKMPPITAAQQDDIRVWYGVVCLLITNAYTCLQAEFKTKKVTKLRGQLICA